VLYFVGQVLGGFFVINRAGELELRKYGSVPVLMVDRRQRFSSSFSDFVTRYTAVSSTNLRTQIAEYYALSPDDGLTMNRRRSERKWNRDDQRWYDQSLWRIYYPDLYGFCQCQS